MTLAMVIVVSLSILLFPGREHVLKGIEGHVTLSTLLLLFVVATLAAVKGTVGFGGSMITTPLFATIIDPTMAVVVLSVMPWMISVFQIGETETGLTYIREEWALVALAGAGTVGGVYFLSVFRAGVVIQFLMGVLVIAYVVFEVGTGFIKIERAYHPVALGSVGLIEGFLIAAANMGPPLPAYLHTFERNPERYVGGMAIIFALIHTLRFGLMYPLGLLTPYRLWLGSVIATVAIGGLFVGTFLRRFGVDQSKFDQVVVALLFLVGLNLLYKTVPELGL